MAQPKTKTIDGIEFTISQPYDAGHTITEAEAKALNQVRSENIGNNLRTYVKEAKEKGTSVADMAAHVAEYDGAYVFTLAGVSAARKLDPVEREARKLAKEVIKAKLAEKGRKLNTIPEGLTKEQWEEKLETAIEDVASRDDILAEAKKIVNQQQKRAEKLMENIDI